MLTKIHKRNEGFTIVETLIVLAIAGLIILIVLLAVPALQRSSRNSNIKSDASAIESAINEFESNNNGALPGTATTDIANTSGTVKITNSSITTAIASTATVQANDIVNNAGNDQTAPTWSTTGATAKGDMSPGVIQVNEDATCNSTVANIRSVAIYYPIETGGGGGVGCIQS